MKNGWEVKRLGDVCDIVNGGTPDTKVKEYWDGGNLWITPKDMGRLNSIFVDETERKITDSGLKNSSAKLLPINSIILSSRAPIGHLAINKKPISTNQGCKGIIPKNVLDFVYLYYFLKKSVELLNSLGSGTTFKELSGSKLAEVIIPLPPLPEQLRIVAILDEAFESIAKAKENAERNLNNAKEIFESYLQSVFENKGDGWESKKLGDVIKLEYGKPLSDDKRNPNGKYPVYGANGEKNRSDEYYYNKLSIIVGRKGSAGEINFTEERFWPLDVTYFVTFDNKEYDLNFIYYLLSKLNLPSLAKGVKPGINRNEVYSINVQTPSLAEQQHIVAKLDALSAETKKLEAIYIQKLTDLDELKKSILQKAFKGELTEASE